MVAIRIPKKLLRDVDIAAKVGGRTRSDYMRLALEEAVGKSMAGKESLK